MPTKQQVLSLLEEGHDYQAAAQRLDVPPGQAFLVATGVAADGGDISRPASAARPGVPAASTQHLVFPRVPTVSPTASREVREWMVARAATDAPMRAAARARDAAPAPPTKPEVTDVADVLTRQHDQVTALLKQLKAIPGVTRGGSGAQLSRRATVVDMVVVALSRHEAAEEEVLWPWVRATLDDGAQRAASALDQERRAGEVLGAIAATAASDDRFDELAEQLERSVRMHVAFEDRVLLALVRATTAEERAEVGRRFLGAVAGASARPQSRTPATPCPGVGAAGAPGGAAGAIREQVGERPPERRGKAEREHGGSAGAPLHDQGEE